MVDTRWVAPDGIKNAQYLRASFAAEFDALAEIDALGHRVLKRLGNQARITDIDELVALALLRRAVTLFAGTRHLFEASSIEPAKLPVRALFET